MMLRLFRLVKLSRVVTRWKRLSFHACNEINNVLHRNRRWNQKVMPRKESHVLNLPFWFLCCFQGSCAFVPSCDNAKTLQLRSGWWEFWKNTTPCIWDLVSVCFLRKKGGTIEKGCFNQELRRGYWLFTVDVTAWIFCGCSHYSNHSPRKKRKKKPPKRFPNTVYPSQEGIFGPQKNMPINDHSPQFRYEWKTNYIAPLKTEDDRINTWQCSCVSMVNHFVVGGNLAFGQGCEASVLEALDMKSFFKLQAI